MRITNIFNKLFAAFSQIICWTRFDRTFNGTSFIKWFSLFRDLSYSIRPQRSIKRAKDVSLANCRTIQVIRISESIAGHFIDVGRDKLGKVFRREAVNHFINLGKSKIFPSHIMDNEGS